MRKKELINYIDEVVARNNELFAKNKDLIQKIADKDKLIEENSRIVESLKQDNITLGNLLDKKSAEFDDLKEKFEQYIAETAKFKVENIYSDSVTVEDEQDTVLIEEPIFEIAEPSVESENNDDNSALPDSFNLNNVARCTAVIKDETLKLCSESIGKIVLSCAELCNKFAVSKRTNSKDLINLALGRTEVFKSEVLTVAGEEMGEERLKAELNSREMAVKEYFELLERQ